MKGRKEAYVCELREDSLSDSVPCRIHVEHDSFPTNYRDHDRQEASRRIRGLWRDVGLSWLSTCQAYKNEQENRDRTNLIMNPCKLAMLILLVAGLAIAAPRGTVGLTSSRATILTPRCA